MCLLLYNVYNRNFFIYDFCFYFIKNCSILICCIGKVEDVIREVDSGEIMDD